MTTITNPVPMSGKGSPPWAIAKLFPNQGDWSKFEYLELSERTNRLIELIDGCVEVLDLPNKKHQRIIHFLHQSLVAFAHPHNLGEAIFAAYPLRLSEVQFREPDVLFVLAEHASWFADQFATGADLVMEVVSEDRSRDFEVKKREYERAGIPEYWIVDPRDERITILRLENGLYTAIERRAGEKAESSVLPGFLVEVTAVFAA